MAQRESRAPAQIGAKLVTRPAPRKATGGLGRALTVDRSRLIERSDIFAVWQALGGGELRHKRGRAFWRDGEHWNVALYRETQSWHDYVAGEGGGILKLIETALDCSRRQAWRWLAHHHGVKLDRPSRAQAANERLRRSRVAAAAAHLERLKAQIAGFVRAVRNSIWSDCRFLESWETAQQDFSDDPRWLEVARLSERRRLADGLDSYLKKLEGMDALALIELRNRLSGRPTCRQD
jgi:hypothetical protein